MKVRRWLANRERILVLLAYTIDKNQGDFVSKTNRSLSVYRRRMTTVELILNIILIISL